MSRLPVISEANGGGDRVYLDTLGRIQALRYTTYLPGGDLSASWQATLDTTRDHRALAPGRRIFIPTGASQGWAGTLDNPQRGNPWQFTATGRAGDAQRFNAYAPSSNNALNLNEALDGAISRGIGWTRSASLPTGSGTNPSGTMTLDAALAAVGAEANKFWTLARGTLAVTMAAPATAVTYQLIATDTAGGRTPAGYVSDVYVTYIEQVSNAQATVLRSASSRPWGRVEDKVDITDRGPITTAAAQAAGDAYLAKNSARLKFAGGFTVARGKLRTLGGVPVDLATVQAGAVMRVMLIDPDSAAGETQLGPVKLVIGQTDYDVDSDVLTLTPLDAEVNVTRAIFGGGPAAVAPAPVSAAQVTAVASEGVASPWQTITAASGFTSTVEARRVGGSIEFRGAFTTSSGSYPTANTSTVAAVGANPYPPAVTRIAACGHTFGGGTAVSVCRVNILSNGSITVQNVEQTSVTTVWLDGVHISAT